MSAKDGSRSREVDASLGLKLTTLLLGRYESSAPNPQTTTAWPPTATSFSAAEPLNFSA